jgi:AcrR family transcriptional regulator
MTATPPSAIPDAALRLLVEQGFDATSVDQLAAAAGISRSTFFRRFGTKEDMVFADMESVISLVEHVLAGGRDSPRDAVVDAAMAVFDHHTSRPEASLLRHRLLQEVPALRDRELVSTHRYERTFRRGLDASDGDGSQADGGTASIAFAAAVVAVHNAFLRRWLRDQDGAIRGELERELRGLARLFGPRLAGRAPAAGAIPRAAAAPAGPAVVVTVLDPGARPEDILAAVREALPRH